MCRAKKKNHGPELLSWAELQHYASQAFEQPSQNKIKETVLCLVSFILEAKTMQYKKKKKKSRMNATTNINKRRKTN